MLGAIGSLVLLTAVGASPTAAEPAIETVISGDQWQASSPNFFVRNHHPNQDARRVAAFCERWRAKLTKYWNPHQPKPWTVPCDVVVHGNSAAYLTAVGLGGRQTFGSSLVKFGTDKQVAVRQIDFRGDHAYGLAAVPHEMTHVVLADLLDGRQPPRWADEGMAILADSHEKQLLHERDLAQGVASRRAFRIAELLSIEAYPQPARIAPFYGQSASVTACLAKRDDPAKFVEFLRRSLDEGYDQALRDIYHLQNIAELEQLWNEQRIAWRSGFHGVRLAIDDAALEAAQRAD